MNRKFAIVVGLALFVGAVVTLKMQGERRAAVEALRSQARQATASSSNSAARPSVTAAGWTAPESEQERRLRIMTGKTNRADFKLSESDIQHFLEVNHTNAASLMAAFELSHDREMLRAAATNFPNDPFVQAKVIMHNVLPEERAKWIENFKKSSPDNSFPNLLAAQDLVKAGDIKGALAEINAAQGKALNDYTRESIQSVEEAYLLSGRSISEAKILASSEIMLPQLAPMKEAGTGLVDLAKKYGTAGDSEGQMTLLRANWEMGQQLRGSTPTPLITDLVGLAMQNNTLKNWPANQPAPFLEKGVADQLAGNTAYRESIRNATKMFDQWFPSAPESEVIAYMDRVKSFGEKDAMTWLHDRHPELTPNVTATP